MKSFKKLQLVLFLFFVAIFPNPVLAYSNYIIPGGENVGIHLESKGVMVVGFYKVEGNYIAKDAGLELGDYILKINNEDITDINSMLKILEKYENKEEISLTLNRNDKELTTDLKIVKDDASVIKTGIYVKDQVNGIGTITYIDPKTNIYGALGHEIIDKNTSSKIDIKSGKIFKAEVTGITKSENGKPGEKNARLYSDSEFGAIVENTESGIYGTYTSELPNKEKVEVGEPHEIAMGEAVIRTVIENNKVEDFAISIIKIDKNSDTKNILFEITDERLLSKTGGVVQGMSGSPILQNNKIIGAVTHVIVNDAKKGYGIFITTMLEEGEN